MEQQATVKGTKFFLVGESPFNFKRPATPLEFRNPRVQHQLELMVAIDNYAAAHLPEGPVEPAIQIAPLPDPNPLARYQQQLRERIFPAMRGVSDLLRIGKPGGSKSGKYITLK